MEREQALVELEILRAEELRASQGKESPLTEALTVAIHAIRGSVQVPEPDEGLNVSQYAARKRVSETAVRKAISTGRLHGAAIVQHERGYTIFPSVADSQWDAFRLAPNGQRQNQQFWPRKEASVPTNGTVPFSGDIRSVFTPLSSPTPKIDPRPTPCTCDFCSSVDFGQVSNWTDQQLNTYHRLHNSNGGRLKRERWGAGR